jgi:hypothetical protein
MVRPSRPTVGVCGWPGKARVPRTRTILTALSCFTLCFTGTAKVLPHPSDPPTVVLTAAAAPAAVAAPLDAAYPAAVGPPPYCHDDACHPRDSAGFVIDGTIQADDLHCVGTDLQRSECFEARRPQCAGHGRKSWAAVVACFAPEVNLYPWPHAWALNVIECESGGDQWATNGQYIGLMQEGAGHGSFDPATEIWTGYHHFYVGGGPGQWSTSGRICHA